MIEKITSLIWSTQVYPHRIKKFSDKKCDVCNECCSTKFISVEGVPYKGLQYCANNTMCENTAKDWFHKATIKKDKLIYQYGESVSIIRTNGSREFGWKICSDAFRDEKDGLFWVIVYDRTENLMKSVALDSLRDWNPSSTPIH